MRPNICVPHTKVSYAETSSPGWCLRRWGLQSGRWNPPEEDWHPYKGHLRELLWLSYRGRRVTMWGCSEEMVLYKQQVGSQQTWNTLAPWSRISGLQNRKKAISMVYKPLNLQRSIREPQFCISCMCTWDRRGRGGGKKWDRAGVASKCPQLVALVKAIWESPVTAPFL